MSTTDTRFKKLVMRFRKQFPEFDDMSDEVCFAFSLFIRDERIKRKTSSRYSHSY